MSYRLLIIGAGSAGSVVIKKCTRMQPFFSEIHVATRNKAILDAFKAQHQLPIYTHTCDADNTHEVSALLKKTTPYCVVNMALPYQDLSIMKACLQEGIHYIDTANYEPRDKAEFCYKWQWDFHDAFKEKGIMALLGCGFDPGVTNVFCAYAQRMLFDRIDTIDIIDCNAGDHGQTFATNFNPEINIREITQPGKYYQQGQWHTTTPLAVSRDIDFPEVGLRRAYLMYHEELESLAKHIPGVRQLRFWMTFSESYLQALTVLKDVGMTAIQPIEYEGKSIVPLQFLKAVMPDPASLAPTYTGKTSIGCVISGIKNNQTQTKVIYNVCEHQQAYADCGAQAVGYTTGVPAAVATRLLCEGIWHEPGVVNIEQCDPLPFLEALPHYGLTWQVADYHGALS